MVAVLFRQDVTRQVLNEARAYLRRNTMSKNLRIFHLGIFLLLTVVTPIEILAKENKSDIAKVSGKAVVFFGPSQNEYELAPPDEKHVLDELLSDFFIYSNKLRAYLKEHEIDSGMTSSRTIEIKLNNGRKVLFKRKKLDSEVGYIMTDGIQKPKVIPAPGTDDDELPAIKEFFKIPD